MGGLAKLVAATCAASLALNAALVAQLRLLQTESGEAMRGKLMRETFSLLSAEEAAKVGQVFMRNKVSELLMAKDVQGALGFDNTTWDREHSATGVALELASVHLLPEEKLTGRLGKATWKAIAERLNSHGVVILPAVFSAAQCRHVAALVNEEILDPWVNFGRIAERRYRKDYPLPLHGAMFEMLRHAVQLLEPALAATLGPDALLTEFSSLTTYPGAPGQNFHGDVGMEDVSQLTDEARLFSAFIYLDDVGENVAPFDVYPGTHTHYHFLSDDEQEMLLSAPFLRLAVPQGSLAIYDSRTIHRGSANGSNLTRPTLYFSMLEQGKPRPEGPTYSLRESYANANVTLSHILARDLPPEGRLPSRDLHDDARCLASIRRGCGQDLNGEDLHDCAVRRLDQRAPPAGPAATRQGGSSCATTEHSGRCPAQGSAEDGAEEQARASEEGQGERPVVKGEGELDEADDVDQDGFHDGQSVSYKVMNRILPGCAVASRLEKVCQAGIYTPGYRARTTWGAL